jgi:4-amino-4-deoxy-L-arabinose transferase-like glycosyltransferase
MKALALTPARRSALHNTSWALVLVLAARLVLGFAYSALNPVGEAPDEADHYAYAAYLAQIGHLPDGPLDINGNAVWMTQSKHPPLYHALAAAVAGWTGMDFTFLRSNPDVSLTAGSTAPSSGPNFFIHTDAESWPWQGGTLAMHLGRLVSVLAGLALVAVTYALGRSLWPTRPDLALVGSAVLAFLPESLFIGGSMSNDMLAAMFAALALWLALSSRTGWGALATGLCLGLGFLSKVSTASLWPVVAAVMVLQDYARGQKNHNYRVFGKALLACTTGLAMAMPWLVRNWRVFGDPLGMRVVLATVDRRQGPLGVPDLIWLARGWFWSFFGRFGGAGQLALPPAFYWLWTGLVLLALAGWLIAALRKRRAGAAPSEADTRVAGTSTAGSRLAARLSVWLVLLGAPLMTVLSILSYSQIALGTDQGRLLFPALAPLALLLAGGWIGCIPDRAPDWLPGAAGALLGATAVLALWLGILRPFAPPPSPPTAEVEVASQVGTVLPDGLDLVAQHWEASATSTENSGARLLTLYWRASQRLDQELRTDLRVSDAEGNLLWEHKRSPGAGRFSTDRWLAGQLVRDSYAVPVEALRQAARVELAVYAFPDETPLSWRTGQWLSLEVP